MKSNAIVLTGLAALAAAGPTASKADIRVDTNRDGIVDVDGTSDQAGKDTWSDASGAIFLPNIGDSGDRCKKLHTGFDLPFDLGKLYDTLGTCHDASDDTQRAPQNLAPMLTVPIAGLSDDATGTITVADEKSRALVRVFRKDGSKWEIVNNDTVFKAQDLKQGLTLGVDARDTRRPEWDGRVKIDFSVRDGQAESKDSVMLRVAPVLMHHHRQAVSQVFTSDFNSFKGQMKTYLDTILDGIQASVKAAGIAGGLTRLATKEAWAQDFFEPTYASMPGPNGTAVAIRVLLEALHDPSTYSTAVLYTTLRGDGVGAVAPNRPTDLYRRGPDFNAGGNLEAIPPYELNGKRFPAGRIIVGGDRDHLPNSMDYFAAQEMQAPLVLDSTWLTVKHVDEMVQAVPAKTERGWAIIAIDPAMGLQMLRDAQAAGHASARVISRPAPARAGPTIDNFLKKDSNMVATEVAAKAMEANLEILKRETGITDAEIHRVPSLISRYEMTKTYHEWSGLRRRGIGARDEASEAALDKEFFDKFPSHVSDDGDYDDEPEAETSTEQRRQAAGGKKPPRYNSVLPSLVNGVPLSDSHYLAPKPFGPVIDGKDIFEEAAAAAYRKAGFTTVDFLEEWRIHTKAGDLHCMSNTFRDTSAQWW
ncbi:Protein-arginine deiminase [Cordyceps fumosorosea ARSEF 2679]|uniref:Protein-arginine deiminase n=1 Tax=Cordyceps fumosorosea (strain ARSEF 2679) TaxID=1081104 RepID=A0A168CE74_CORFA|nr:Protein-arginine deiminase [Cordyceps fumosorosea ARSEF 2679]OAA71275.1 Protein-arginine deiminase [Cordyceps fumosorosea ARSEF 2679]